TLLSWENNPYYEPFHAGNHRDVLTTKFDVLTCEISGHVSSGQVVTFTVPRFLPLTSASIQLTVKAPSTTGRISGSVNITADTPDSETRYNAVDFANDVIEPLADLIISISDSPDPVTTGDSFIYTITAYNNDGTVIEFAPPLAPTTTAFGVVLTATLPEGVTFQSATTRSLDEVGRSLDETPFTVDSVSGRD